MTEERFQWTTSQKRAQPFVESGVQRQMTATAALREYRLGGGAIRDAYWYSLYKEEFAYRGTKDKIEQIPNTYIVPETMFKPTDFDYYAKYIMRMRVSGYSEELDMRIVKNVTVESDELITKAEWRYGAQMAIDNTLGSPPMIVDRIWDYEAKIRVR